MRLSAWLLLALCGAGCGRAQSGSGRFIPSDETARATLTTVFSHWQDGQPLDSLLAFSPAIRVADSHRKPGQALERFEILGEAPGAGSPCYAVRLTLTHPSEEQTVRFIVNGLDPIWVFRHEDYEMAQRWEHPMPPVRPGENKGTPRSP